MKIKYFNQFLYESLNVSDTCTEISEAEALNILEKTIEYFGDFRKIPLLYRGIRSQVDYMIQDMTGFNRVSSYSKVEKSINLHNLYMSHDHKFDNYNKRNKSVIFTNNKYEAKQYGDAYLVIPLNIDAKISYVCTNDIYEIVDDPRQIEEKFNMFIYVLDYFGYDVPKLNYYTINWDEFVVWLTSVNEIYNDLHSKISEHKKEILYSQPIFKSSSMLDDITDKIIECDSMDELLEKYLFKYQNQTSTISESMFNETYSKLKTNQDYKERESIELQTEEKCALIRLDSNILEKYIKVK